MILSTKLLRKINPEVPLACCHCGKQAAYYDAATADCPVGYCGDHALLEDLDPDDRQNKQLMYGCVASRLAAFPECMDIQELFSAAPRVAKDKRAAAQMWVRLTTGLPPQGLDDVVARPHVVEWLRANSIYGADHRLDTNHYIEIHLSQAYGQRLAYIFLKFQQILGTRFLAVVPEKTVATFFGDDQP